MSTLREKIVETAKRFGADAVGFSHVDRFASLPENNRPETIFPGAKTVICLCFRVLRGCYRGVEEGTTYYMYTTVGVETNEETRMPICMLNVCGAIEDEGYEAAPQKNWQLLMEDIDDTNPEMNYRKIYYNTHHPQLDFRITPVLCGMGEIGKSGSILTDDYGPFQRFCFIITDAELSSDPIIKPHLCDGCDECRHACFGDVFSNETEIFAGSEYYKRNNWMCAAYTKGANRTKNPFMPPHAMPALERREEILTGTGKLTREESIEVMDQLVFYPPARHSYTFSMCAKACDRACYIHLEKKGALKRHFDNSFRQKEDWKLPLDNDDDLKTD